MQNEKLTPPDDGSSTLAGDVSAIVQRLPRYAKLSWLLLRDQRLSAKQRAVLTAALGYSISPIDLVPGIIPVIGQMDDLAVVLLALRWILRSLPRDAAGSHLEQSGIELATIDADLDILKRNGVKILKRARIEAALGAAFVLGVGRYAGREILRSIKERGKSKEEGPRQE